VIWSKIANLECKKCELVLQNYCMLMRQYIFVTFEPNQILISNISDF